MAGGYRTSICRHCRRIFKYRVPKQYWCSESCRKADKAAAKKAVKRVGGEADA